MKIRSSGELVEILKDYLKEQKISLRQFSTLVGIPHSTILTWKKKNTLPSIEFIAKIASFMNVSLDWLVYEEQFDNVKVPMIKKSEEKLFCSQ